MSSTNVRNQASTTASNASVDVQAHVLAAPVVAAPVLAAPVSVTTPQSRAKGGRRSGAKGWREAELDLLLEVIEQDKPCGKKQWENVATSLVVRGGYHRSADACKKRFDKLWSTPKPTGSSEVPRHVVRAQIVKEKISSHEVIGYVNQNDFVNEDDLDDDSESPMKGTNLCMEGGGLRRPVPKKRKAAEMSAAVLELSEGNKEAAKTLAGALQKVASTLGSGSANADLERRVIKLEAMESKLDLILKKLSG
jgi:hypothetical protein